MSGKSFHRSLPSYKASESWLGVISAGRHASFLHPDDSLLHQHSDSQLDTNGIHGRAARAANRPWDGNLG
jgi:hypothetical protein